MGKDSQTQPGNEASCGHSRQRDAGFHLHFSLSVWDMFEPFITRDLGPVTP